jgi:hypothetical protein
MVNLGRKLDFSLLSPKKGQTLEKVTFSGAHFPCERNGQPNFKFYMDSEVLFIYRLIPRKFDLMGRLAAFSTLPRSVAFWGYW